MKLLIAAFALLILHTAYSGIEEKRGLPTFVKTDSVFADTLTSNEAIFYFQLENLDPKAALGMVQFSIDGVSFSKVLNEGKFDVKTTPGKHIFVIYINENYFEIYSDSLEIQAQMIDTYNVQAEFASIEIMVDKPVIYLYPETETAFSVSVNPVGKFTFTYPEYDSNWSGIAQPDGKIEINGAKYPYLFWEAKQTVRPIDPSTTAGYVIASSEAVDFLNTQLDYIGFTSEEKADFITFWGPRMIQHPNIFVTFHQNETCDQFAQLAITPTPDHVERCYISWAPCENTFIPASQELTPMQRDGFTVIEWGGQQTELINHKINL